MDCARRVEEVCARYDFAYYGEWGTIIRGWCAGGTDGAEQINAALRRLRAQGALARLPYYQALLAETLLGAGHSDAAGAVLDAARARAAVHDDRWWLPELWRLDALRHSGMVRDQLLRNAIAVAEQQGSPVLLERAANDLRTPLGLTSRSKSSRPGDSPREGKPR